MSAQMSIFGPLDYISFAIVIFISASIGVYFHFTGRKQNTTEEFLLAGRRMSIFPVVLSLVATSFSAVSVLGNAGEMYNFGIALAFVQIGHAVGTFVSSYIFLPVYFEMQVTTSYEYLERRFGKTTRILCSITFVIEMVLYTAVIIFAPALALSTVTNISTWVAVTSIGAVCTFYCALGGMKAVLWTDAFQAIFMYVCIFAVVIKGCLDVDGISNVFRIASDGGRLKIPGAEMDLSVRYTMWNIFLQGAVSYMAGFGTGQLHIQRLLTVKNLKRSRMAIFLTIPASVVFGLMTCLTGIIIYANFAGCDPLTSEDKLVTSADQLLPYYIMKSLGHLPGLPGLCLCGVFSATLSSVSSTLNCLTAVTLEDFIKSFHKAQKMDQRKLEKLAKVITVIYGLVCILFTFLITRFGQLIQAWYTIHGTFSGPVFGVFCLGMMTTRSNKKGVIVGLLTSVALFGWISIGASSSAPHLKTLPVSTAGCSHEHYNLSNTAWENLTLVSYKDFTAETYSNSSKDRNNFNVSLSDFNSSDDEKAWSEKYVFPLYTLSYMWFGVLSFLASIVVGYLASLFTSILNGKTSTTRPEYLSPIRRWFLQRKDDDKPENGKSDIFLT